MSDIASLYRLWSHSTDMDSGNSVFRGDKLPCCYLSVSKLRFVHAAADLQGILVVMDRQKHYFV